MTTIYDAADIRKIRQQLKMNATEFAALLGVSSSAVWYWERSLRTPRLPIHERLRELKNGGKK